MTLRKPESTSITKAIAFNRHDVKMFFDNLQILHDRLLFWISGIR